MSVAFQNYAYSFVRGGKPIFVPSDLGYRIGEDLKRQLEKAYAFDQFVYHLRRSGGHVSALHAHRPHVFFARLDISRFFYSIARNRVRRALSEVGIARAQHYAKWSCVKNPWDQPSYVLPYGFVQSAILATLVLMKSHVGYVLREFEAGGVVLPTVYMDDISLSSNDFPRLTLAFHELREAIETAQFTVNAEKTIPPGPAMELFNCEVRQGQTTVTAQRMKLFEEQGPSAASEAAFNDYCASVEFGNA